MSEDITNLLKAWEYEPGDQIRVVKADDGRDILQVRQPLGIEQYELEGRPDGKRPFNRESVLDEFLYRIDNNPEYTINHEDFLLIQNEGIIYYFRYLVLFQIGDFKRTVRDTEHNLKICNIVEDHAEIEEDKKDILQYKPYIMRMNAISRAMILLHHEMKTTATEVLESTINAIETMPEIDTPAFQFERIRSVNYLKSTLKQVTEQKGNPLEKLHADLEKAVKEENYELAAEIRDRIKDLESRESDSNRRLV